MCVTDPDIQWFCKRISDCGEINGLEFGK